MTVVPEELKDLFEILALKRAYNTKGEFELIKRFIKPTGAKRDDYGNYILRIGNAPVLWSCHTDTVHSFDTDTHKQKLLYNPETGIIMADSSECLGADNGAGIWILLEMIKAKVEGLYIFHREEEIGGKGSRFILEQTPELLDGIQTAIAFDRKGVGSVITHQITKCCSNQFGTALINLLSMEHKLDDGGTFTDTANYVSLIPECTNISAGFYHEHTHREYLDTKYLLDLKNRVCAVDITTILDQVNRDVGDQSWPDTYGWGQNRNPYNDYVFGDDFYELNQDLDRTVIVNNPELVYEVLKYYGLLKDVVADVINLKKIQ